MTSTLYRVGEAAGCAASALRHSHLRRRVQDGVALLLTCVVVLGAIFLTVQRSESAPRGGPHARPQGAGAAWQTYMLLGLDQRADEAPRSDTIIIVNWDRSSRRANVLSLPRDLWVQIPGYGWDKLSTAYTLGVGSDGPGGPELVKRTLKANLGIEVDHYGAVTLQGFERIIDRVGGVWLDVRAPLLDNEFPGGNGSYRRLFIAPGLQRMDGGMALAYARSRHADSDFGRARRQQEVLSAIRDRVVKLHSPSSLPGLLGDLRREVKTDISTVDALKLAPDALRLNMGDMRTRTLDLSSLQATQTGSGLSILAPKSGDWQALRQTVRRALEAGS
ncbi:MAG: LCP family protein [Chloroflexota bacterium]|nr:LCP family protein [Chloroflexota bacterium]